MIKMDGKNEGDRVEKRAAKPGERREMDLPRSGFVHLRKTKTDEPRQIPINDTLAEIFAEIRREQGLSSEHVFTYRPNAWKLYKKGLQKVEHIEGRSVRRIERGFKAAVERAGIKDLRFHDLRHTFASHLIMRGASLKEVQELLGHGAVGACWCRIYLNLCHNVITSITFVNNSNPLFKKHSVKPRI